MRSMSSLLDLVMKFLTPDVIVRIANALGIDRGVAEKAIAALVPTILAGFAATSQSGGAQRIADAAKQQQAGLVDGFVNRVGVGNGTPPGLVDQGLKQVASLFGGTQQSEITQAVSRYSGASPAASASLLGMLTPAVLGVIAKESGTRGPNAAGIADLLAEQKDEIAKAIPSGFARQLSGTNFLDSIGGMAATGAGAAKEMAHQTAAAVRETAEETFPGDRDMAYSGRRAGDVTPFSVPSWALWVIPVALAAGLAWYFLADRPQETTFASISPGIQITTPGQPRTATPGQPASPTQLAVAEINTQLTQSLGTLRTSLSNVTDAVSANAALPKLREVTAEVDRVVNAVGQLPVEARRMVEGVDANTMAALNRTFDRLMTIPGVSDILKPTIDTLKQKLQSITV
jgi:hypothetical protein